MRRAIEQARARLGEGYRMGDRIVLLQLLHCLRNAGVRDPNVELFIAVLESETDHVERAITAGADVNMTDSQVVNHYRVLLSKHCPEQLRAWTEGGPGDGGTIM